MAEILNITIERFPTDALYDQIVAMRQEMFYSSPFDSRYWRGGVHSLLTKQQMRDVQREDASSYFFLVQDNHARLQAYARVSIRYDVQSQSGNSELANSAIHACKVHIIAVCAERQHNKYRLHTVEGCVEDKISRALYKAIFAFCLSNNVAVILADVCVTPVPNLPSLSLHAKMGFVPVALDTEVYIRSCPDGEDCKINFIRLAAPVSRDWALQRSADGKLCLMEAQPVC